MNDHRILIVEDEVPIRGVIAKHFLKEGFEVLEAGHGHEGFEIAKKEQPDIILLDIMMPVMDGIQMLEMIEEDPETDDIPIVFLSNLSDGPKVDRAKEKSPSHVLVKANTNIEEIVEMVKEKLGMS